MAQSRVALQTFSLTNDIVEVSPQDQIYKYDAAADRAINNSSPWSTEYVHIGEELIIVLYSMPFYTALTTLNRVKYPL